MAALRRGRSHYLEPALPDGGGDGAPDAGDCQRACHGAGRRRGRLDFYRLLTAHYRDALRPGGWLVLEIGCTQAADVLALGAANGWVNGSCRKDYGSNDRAVCCKNLKKAAENPIYRTQNTQQNVVNLLVNRI